MKKLVFAVMVLSLFVLVGCGGLEGRGDAAWKEAQRHEEGSNQRLMKQKEAYERFREAYIGARQKGKVSAQLLNKYLLSAVARIEFIFGATGSPNAPAVEVLRKDIEEAMKSSQEITAEVRDRYARFLISVAQHHRNNEDVSRFKEEVNNARNVAANKTITDAVEREAKAEFALFNVGMAQEYMREAEAARRARNSPDLDFIRAEYYAKAALISDPNNVEAQRILATTRKELIPVFTAYEAAVLEYSDTALFRQINSDGVLMAVPTIRATAGRTQLDISLYNNSFNNIKPRAEMFSITTTDGRRVVAERVEFERNVLNQKHDVAGKLFFRGNFNRDNIKKLSFHFRQNEDIPAITGDKYFQ